MADTTTPLVAADGTPLKRKLAQSLMRSRARAFCLALPLLAFILVLFVYSLFATGQFAAQYLQRRNNQMRYLKQPNQVLPGFSLYSFFIQQKEWV